jgi:hypothetical protein
MTQWTRRSKTDKLADDYYCNCIHPCDIVMVSGNDSTTEHISKMLRCEDRFRTLRKGCDTANVPTPKSILIEATDNYVEIAFNDATMISNGAVVVGQFCLHFLYLLLLLLYCGLVT